MSTGIAIWLIGAFVWSLFTVFRVPGAFRSLTMINMAFWTGLMWPIYLPVLCLGKLMGGRPK